MPKLDRIPHFDPRSRSYGVRELLPRRVERRQRLWALPTGYPLNQGQEGACFTGDVLIRMADGSQRRIEDVRLLDEVATAEGNVGRVLQLMARPYSGPLIRIVAWGHSHLRCTPEHPILTKRGYVPARELVDGDWIALPKYLPRNPPTVILPSEIVSTAGLQTRQNTVLTFHGLYGATETKVQPLPDKIELNEPFGRLMGLYAAEGFQTSNKVIWAYGSHEHETLVPETVELIKRCLGADARVQHRPNNGVYVVLYGKHWRLLLSALVPGTAKHGDKHLSANITNAPADFLRAVLDGWYDGDGHLRRRVEHESRDGITVCDRLALDMHAIAVAHGLRPALVHSRPSMNRHAATRQWRWNLTVPVDRQSEAPEEPRPNHCQCGCGELVALDHRHRVNRFVNGHNLRTGPARTEWRSEDTDRHLWRRVREVVEQPFGGEYVFNMHVEGDNSYIAEGVGVHNCVGFGYTGELAADPIVVPGADQAYAFRLYELARAEDRKMGNNWPEGASMLAGAKALKNAGKISGYRWAFGIDDVLDTLSAIGPVVLGIDWLDGMYQTRLDGLVEVHGPVVGGHCIVANGYWPNHPKFGDVVVWTNSWGRSYGLDGVGFIRVPDLAARLEQRGEAAIVVDVAPVAPTPPPAPVEQLFTASKFSRCFHRKGAHWWLPEVRAWPSRDAAIASGLRPCSLCKP